MFAITQLTRTLFPESNEPQYHELEGLGQNYDGMCSVPMRAGSVLSRASAMVAPRSARVRILPRKSRACASSFCACVHASLLCPHVYKLTPVLYFTCGFTLKGRAPCLRERCRST